MQQAKTKAKVIIFYGASQSGKDFFAEEVMRRLNGGGYNTQFLPKYLTRPRRAEEAPNCVFIEELEQDHDIIGDNYGHPMAVKSAEVKEMLSKGISPVFVSADEKMCAELMKTSGSAIAFKILFEHPKTLQGYLNMEMERNPDIDEETNRKAAEKRFAKYQKIEASDAFPAIVACNPYDASNTDPDHKAIVAEKTNAVITNMVGAVMGTAQAL